MTIDEHEDLASLSRRSFLRVALGTLPAAALSGGPLAALWPTGERGREVDEPYLLCKDGRSIWDPGVSVQTEEPTLIELLAAGHDHHFLGATGDELDELLEAFVIEDQGLDPEEDGAALEARVEALRGKLDEPADLSSWSHAYDAWLDRRSNEAAHSLWDEFCEERLEEAGLYLVEGDVPGSNYFSVCYDGSVDQLNAALARVGLNAVVEARAR